MTKMSHVSMTAIAALLVAPSLASAGLKDSGPVNAVTGFPQWYRDTSGAAVALCTEQRPSPNASAGGSPMCFPIVPNPDGFAGNLGDENFYFMASTSLAGPNGFTMFWESALEATYANGTPIRGEEIVFARIRIRMDTQAGGTYKITHPYGVEVFPDVQPGNRGVNYTVDIGVNPGVFTGALSGTIGPFLEWEANAADPASPFGVDPASSAPYQLSIANADGSAIQFLGDPNLLHAVQGSPFATNYVRVDGPPGSNLDGAGNDFLVTNLFAIVGQRYTAPIPVPLHVYRANYSVDRDVTKVNVFAESTPGMKLIATAGNVPTHELSVDPVSGEAYGDVEFPYDPTLALSPDVKVTNVSDDPHSHAVAPLTDIVSTSAAVYFPDPSGVSGGTLSIIAETSVHTDPAPTIAIVELPGAAATPQPGTPWIQRFDATLPAGATPPWELTALSSAGGRHAQAVIIGTTGTFAPQGPVAESRTLSTQEGQPVSFLAADPVAASTMVLNPPANGTAVVNADGTITYTPKSLFNGADSFTYVLSTSGATRPVYSNAATVSVSVTAVNQPPTAVADAASAAPGTATVIAVAANDTDVDGTVQPTTVAIATPPVAGSATVNADGTITFVPGAGFAGTMTFTYTIADDQGAVSAPGTVTVTVLAQSEVLRITRAEWVASKGRWKITGTSSAFGPGIVNNVTVRVGTEPNLGGIVGTAPIDVLGNWSLDTTNTSVSPDGTNRISAFSTGGGSTTATVTRK